MSRAIVAGDVVDIFRSMGVDRPDLSILSDDFLEEVRELPQKNVALELLNKLLNDEIRTRSRRNVVEARSFKALLERAIQSYRNRSLTSAQVIAELIELAKRLRESQGRGEDLGLSEEELAFYDALAASEGNGIADDELRAITRELVDTVRRNATVDWALKESARANLRRLVKRLLRKHGYPSGRQDEAVQLVLAQAEAWSDRWAA